MTEKTLTSRPRAGGRGAGAIGEPSAAGRRWLGIAVFALALAVRLLFQQATPDRAWPHTALYKGDALVWTDWAGSLTRGGEFELGLPLRPPANAYLLAALGVRGPADARWVKPLWAMLGALAVLLIFHAAAAAFGLRVALVVGLWSAFSTALLVLSASLNSDTPYLVLVGLALLVTSRPGTRPALADAVVWGSANGLACLFRVEHVVFFAVAGIWWLGGAGPGSHASRVRRRAGAAATLAFVAVIAPWHLDAWARIRDFNAGRNPLDPAAEAAQRAVEAATRGLEWTPAALAARAELPGFARRSAANFVAATVAVRGGRVVDAGDFRILEEAFGTRPRPLPAFPFVALYGPLNFYLANRAGAPPGFDPGGLDRPPRLAGGPGRYPWALVAGLPPRELNLHYPPHLEMVSDGYRLGWRALAEQPAAAARRALARLDLVWRGAALGWTGYGLPWGVEGVRRAADLAVPEGPLFAAWRIVLLALVAAGTITARRRPALAPWLAFAASKLLAGTLFFGYARHGAALVPVVAVVAGLSLTRVARRTEPRRLFAAAAAVSLLGLAVEARRFAAPPALLVDGAPIAAGDPHPSDAHRDRRVRLAR